MTFSRAMIDAGADVVTASGPHVLRGIEIYKGQPIFYGLGDFIFQNETLLRQPPENYEPLGLSRSPAPASAISTTAGPTTTPPASRRTRTSGNRWSLCRASSARG